MRLFAAVALAVCLMLSHARAQPLEFEVATVKVPVPVPLGTAININLGTFRNGTLTMANVTLGECLQFAHALVSQEQVVGPEWIKSRETRFDIVAKAAPATTLDGV